MAEHPWQMIIRYLTVDLNDGEIQLEVTEADGHTHTETMYAGGAITITGKIPDELTRLREQVATLTAALEWYADDDNYSFDMREDEYPMITEAGRRARDALTKVKGE